MNKQPYAIPPKWWGPKLSPPIVRWTRSYRRWKLRSQQKIRSVNVSGEAHLRNALQSGHGVLITPNHAAHYDSAALYVAADEISTPLFYMTAWQVFGMATVWDRFLMQRLGCFSIDRESSDRRAYKQAVSVLHTAPCPLVIFPEGDIYHSTDRVTPFREGAAAIAMSAARRGSRPIAIVPCGIKFRYLDDPTRKLHQLMSELDEQLLLRPQAEQPLVVRIYRFAEALLALKEIEFLGASQSGSLADRIPCLANSILSEMESRYSINNRSKAVPERVKDLRQKIILGLDEIKNQRPTEPSLEFVAFSQDMDDLFLVMQLYSYPGDYLTDNPSVERLAETLDKFEEDILDREVPAIRGRRIVDVRFGEPLVLPAGKSSHLQVGELTRKMQGSVQRLVDELAGQGSYAATTAKPVAASV